MLARFRVIVSYDLFLKPWSRGTWLARSLTNLALLEHGSFVVRRAGACRLGRFHNDERLKACGLVDPQIT